MAVFVKGRPPPPNGGVDLSKPDPLRAKQPEEFQKRPRGRPKKYITVPLSEYRVHNGPMTLEMVDQIRKLKLPAIQETRKIAQIYCAAAIERLVHIALHSQDERAAIVAANAILERGIGKPKEAVDEEKGQGIDLSTLRPEELSVFRNILARALGVKDNAGDVTDVYIEDRDTGPIIDVEPEPIAEHEAEGGFGGGSGEPSGTDGDQLSEREVSRPEVAGVDRGGTDIIEVRAGFGEGVREKIS